MRDAPATLCLCLDAADLPRLRNHPLLKAIAQGRATKARRAAALVDTPERGLLQAGWLCLNEGTVPVLLPLSPAKALPLPMVETLGPLGILAQGELQRIVIPLAGGRLVLDQLKLTRGKKADALAWMRLEAFALDQAAELAASLGRDIPFTLLGVDGAVALAARLGLAQPAPVKAMEVAVQIPEGDSALAASAAILRHCLNQFEANIQPVLDGRDSEGVHQMRVALRRLRSALDVFSPILPASWLEGLLEDLRWLNQPLGKRRDLDVFLEETLQPLRAAEPGLAGLENLQVLLEARREAAQVALVSALQSPRAAFWLLRLRRLAHADEAEALKRLDTAQHDAALQPAIAFAALTLRRRRKKLRKLGDAHATLSVPDLHRLRIRTKKLRYASEFFRYLFAKKPAKRAAVALAQLQDTLGALNDAAVGDHLLGGVLGAPGDDPAAAAIAGWFAARQATQLAKLGNAWEAYVALKPFWKSALPTL